MKNHKKIYYVPGTLTLILLPVFCYFYLKQFIKSERVIETTVFEVYRPHLDEDCSRRFDTSMLSGPLIKRNYATIELTGGANLDKDKLKSFQENLEKIYKMKDTV